MKITLSQQELALLQATKDIAMANLTDEQKEGMETDILADLSMGYEIHHGFGGEITLIADEVVTLQALRAYNRILRKALPILLRITKSLEPFLSLFACNILDELKDLVSDIQIEVEQLL